MAKTTRPKQSRKASSKRAPTRKAAPAKGRKAPAKASKRAAPARKAAPARPKARRPATRVESSAMPEHAASVAAARRAVARPTKAHHEAQMEKAEHDHQDPRLSGIPGIGHEGEKVQVENYGQFKNKAVGRMDKPVNWFRRAAKPKS